MVLSQENSKIYDADALFAVPLRTTVDNNYVRILRERFRSRRLQDDSSISVVSQGEERG